MESNLQLRRALHALHYVFPAIILAYYVIATGVSICTLQTLKKSDRKAPRLPLLGLQAVVLFLYGVEALMLLIDTLAKGACKSSMDTNVYALLEVLIWMILNVSLIESGKCIVWYPLYGSWFIAISTETVLFGLAFPGLVSGPFDYAQVFIKTVRLVAMVLLPFILFFLKSPAESPRDEESVSLLGSNRPATSDSTSLEDSSSYGSISDLSLQDPDGVNIANEHVRKYRDQRKQHRRRLQLSGNWFTYLKEFSVFVPLIWPSGQIRLQLSMFGVALCLIAASILTVLIPRQLGLLIDSLTDAEGQQNSYHILQLALFLLYQYLNSSYGLAGIRTLLWLPVSQSAEKNIKLAAHKTIMNLSRDFHTHKSSREIFKSIDQGNSVTQLLYMVFFIILPPIIDISVAFVYLTCVFGGYMAILVGSTLLAYFQISSRLYAKQIEPRRRLTDVARKEAQVMYESAGEWNTVTYFSRQRYEQDRFSGAVDARLKADKKYEWLYVGTRLAQEHLMQLGLAAACILVAYQVVHGTQKVGNFAMLVLYYSGFTGDLAYITYANHQVLQYLIDAESLLDLLNTEASVEDGSTPFNFKRGAVVFDDVGFAYKDHKTVIKEFSFNARPGQRVALVGETGAGKTTILRLLFRFYDVQTGSIMIDGQDIRDVTLDSLRRYIGVVPQDPSLFNDTIMANVRYARLSASDGEVMEACRAAAIHDKIMTYADGYSTKVGEHGIKLSGGELQRISIARVILMNPKIVLLDEATSSIDSDTEGLIQSALHQLTKGRTTFTIAHRISTVKKADVVLVIQDGSIVEQGPPDKLLKADGKFSSLWKGQFGSDHIPEHSGDSLNEADDGNWSHAHQNLDYKKHLQEGSASSSGKTFRPDAPEFVPRYQRGTEASGGQPSHTHGASGHQHSHNDTSSYSHTHSVNGPKLARGLFSRNKKASAPTEDSQRKSEASTPDSRPTTTESKYDGPPPETELYGKRPHSNRWQRRHQIKSEPHGSALRNGQADGTTERLTPGGSGESTARRRVSAPGDPPSGATSVKEPSHAQRRRRQRHLRIKKREAAGLTSSGTLSAEASSALSSDTNHAITPTAPATTPTYKGHPFATSKVPVNGSVHFAAGS